MWLLPITQAVFVGALLIFFISWCFPRIKKLLHSLGFQRQSAETDEVQDSNGQVREAEYSEQQNIWKDNIQRIHEEKASQYKERVLIPREKEKKQKLEKEFYKHFGPLWSGEGNVVGGEDDSTDENETDLSASSHAARRRKIPEAVTSSLKSKEATSQPQPKRVIVIPEEPLESDPDSVLVVMRTPISTIVSRRFHRHHKFQNILDLMTKSGFSQRHYQLFTSYPRTLVSGNPEMTLSDMKLERKVILNVEDKSDGD